jgi:hypothetical protein
MIFTNSGLVILDEEAIYVVNVQAQGLDLTTLYIRCVTALTRYLQPW